MTTPTLDALGAVPLVRPENVDTAELHQQVLASWTSDAAARAATFDRTSARKAAFHRKRADELAAENSADAKRLARAESNEQHWRDQEGRGEDLVERLVTGLSLLPQTPISQVASWAVWDDRTPGDPHWYEHRVELEGLTSGTDVPHTGAVFLGINAGEFAAQAERPQPWSMFHGSTQAGVPGAGRHGNIRNLADHIRDTPLWGSYMTDYYKNIPSVDEQILKALLDAAPTPDIRALNTLMALIVRDEVTQLGLDPAATHAIALGSRVGNLARKTMRDWAGVCDVPHYAAYIKPEAFRSGIDAALAVTHPEFSRDEQTPKDSQPNGSAGEHTEELPPE